MRSKLLSFMMLVTLVRDDTVANKCSRNFKYEGGFCLKRPQNLVLRLYEQSKYCAAINGHVMSIKDILKLRGRVNFYYSHLLRSNYFLTGSFKEPLYDADIGFKHSAALGIHFINRGFPSKYLVMTLPRINYLNAYVTYDVQKSYVVCIENEKKPEKTVYEFTVGFEGQQKRYHNSEVTSKFSVNVDTTSRAICLAKCAKNEYCSAAYFSESKKLCTHRIYMDTFLHQDDKRLADDFERYAIYR